VANIQPYLAQQLVLHPSMQMQDIVKLCYQAAFGAEHLLSNVNKARAYFFEEYARTNASDVPLFERISDDVCRVNLAAWKQAGLPPEWLFNIFAASMYPREDGAALFFDFLQQAGLEPEDIPVAAVHHSAAYRAAEQPAYRIVCARFARLLPILPLMGMMGVVAIDGRAASGKTTMARHLAIATGSGVVHMDDFFLPGELRNPERFAAPGGNIHHERFTAEVMPQLRNREAFHYRIFDCTRMDYNGDRQVAASTLRIVEGAYSHHPILGMYADIRVFADIDQQVQMERIKKRNGLEAAAVFEKRWIPMEEEYIRAYGVDTGADVVV